ncbi:hypothetical protein K470DRAFT_264523 [Piedraia hortae CBS 480.64]|uniref:Uncharacterized protein n=1 Tax=Piedraia hortae CBS 480.64 TaxID=1314780 RepID=A0A6A7C074_9PEZI|nr:hypothetical protein K470DRAFT_264523 [Piedraia hortae CBS 480.64]
MSDSVTCYPDLQVNEDVENLCKLLSKEPEDLTDKDMLQALKGAYGYFVECIIGTESMMVPPTVAKAYFDFREKLFAVSIKSFAASDKNPIKSPGQRLIHFLNCRDICNLIDSSINNMLACLVDIRRPTYPWDGRYEYETGCWYSAVLHRAAEVAAASRAGMPLSVQILPQVLVSVLDNISQEIYAAVGPMMVGREDDNLQLVTRQMPEDLTRQESITDGFLKTFLAYPSRRAIETQSPYDRAVVRVIWDLPDIFDEPFDDEEDICTADDSTSETSSEEIESYGEDDDEW